jgi:hypothetical protein
LNFPRFIFPQPEFPCNEAIVSAVSAFCR